MNTAEQLKYIREHLDYTNRCGDDADVQEALAAIPRLLDALERVLAIHYPTDVGTDMQWCAECYVNDDPAEVEWPCPTVTAINEALEGK